MATGRIGVTPTLGTRWSKAPAGGTTSLSGLDDNSVSLVYSVGYEQVYRNGVLLSRTNDYTATTGNSITLIDATIAGDIIEVFANELVPLTDAISKGQFTAKGALLSATAASTPAVLTVGSNNQVLTADSTTSTGLKWASVASTKNFSLLNAGGTSLSGSSTVTISGISNADVIFVRIIGASSQSNPAQMYIRVNSNSGAIYNWSGVNLVGRATYGSNIFQTSGGTSQTEITAGDWGANSSGIMSGYLRITGAATSGEKTVDFAFGTSNGGGTGQGMNIAGGTISTTSTISSISIIEANVTNFDAGTVFVYTSA